MFMEAEWHQPSVVLLDNLDHAVPHFADVQEEVMGEGALSTRRAQGGQKERERRRGGGGEGRGGGGEGGTEHPKSTTWAERMGEGEGRGGGALSTRRAQRGQKERERGRGGGALSTRRAQGGQKEWERGRGGGGEGGH